MKNLIDYSEKIFVAGASGMCGSAIVRKLLKHGYGKESNGGILLTPNRKELDLTDFNAVRNWFRVNKPTIVVFAAAKVGGILANSTEPASFLLDNIKIQTNVIESAWLNGVKRLLFLGSSCIYPKLCKQPIKEKYLLTSELESTNEWYAIAKIAGLKMVESYRKQYGLKFVSVMPTNMYGPNDNYHEKNSHVLAALIKKFVIAKKDNSKIVEIWGTGKPLREFMHVDDFSRALLVINKKYDENNPINVGTGEEISIKNLSKKISKLVNFKGQIKFNKKYPDGTPRKILDSTKIYKLGWRPKINLEKGIKKTIKNFLNENFSNPTSK